MDIWLQRELARQFVETPLGGEGPVGRRKRDAPELGRGAAEFDGDARQAGGLPERGNDAAFEFFSAERMLQKKPLARRYGGGQID